MRLKGFLFCTIAILFSFGAIACNEPEEKGIILDFPTLVENYKIFQKSSASDIKLELNLYGKKISSLTMDNNAITEYSYSSGILTLKKEFLSTLEGGERKFKIQTDKSSAEFTILITDILEQPSFTQELLLKDIVIRDPYMFKDPKTNVYYLIKSYNAQGQVGVVAYRSYNLKAFAEPITLYSMPVRSTQYPDNPNGFWAPELHFYNGNYYIFVTYSYPDLSKQPRQTYIIKSDAADGEYTELADMTDPTRYCLDGTLWVENGTPYGIYCDEWSSAESKNGTMKYYQLKQDLSGTIGSPIHMFYAIDNEINVAGDIRVTDGCFLYRKPNGELYMLWSTFGSGKYVLTYARSSNGKFDGEWIQAKAEEALFTDDGGHGMVFVGPNNRPHVIFHSPNSYSPPDSYEKAQIYELDISVKDSIKLGKKF